MKKRLMLAVIASLWGSTSAWPETAPNACEAAAFLPTEGQQLLAGKTTKALPAWSVFAANEHEFLGQMVSTRGVKRSTGCFSKPLDVYLALDAAGQIIDVKLIVHAEPMLTLGFSDQHMVDYVCSFTCLGVGISGIEGDPPETITEATLSTGVIRACIRRTAHILARSDNNGLDQVSKELANLASLLQTPGIAKPLLSSRDARAALTDANSPLPNKDGTFLELWVPVLDPPILSQNLLDAAAPPRAMAAPPAEHDALMRACRGLHSHRCKGQRHFGILDRVLLELDGRQYKPTSLVYQRLNQFEPQDVPNVKEDCLFAIPRDQIDLIQQFEETITAKRNNASFPITFPFDLGARFLMPAATPPALGSACLLAWAQKNRRRLALQ